MSKVTIFTAPKAFTDPHINIIQRNAIRSWKDLGQQVDILLIGEEAGMEDAAAGLGVRHIPGVDRNEFGTPLVSSVFNLARKEASSEMMIYLNSDILLLPRCLEILDEILQLEDEFLLVGQRWNLDIKHEMDFPVNWQEEIISQIKMEGVLSAVTAMDYFIFPRQLFQEIPPFAIGRAGWDNWMIYHAVQQPWPVIDITPSHKVVHQNHDYMHLPGGVPHYKLEESRQNVSLSGGMRTTFDLLDVELTYQNGTIHKKPISVQRILRKLERMVMPEDTQGWLWQVTRILRKTRRKISKLR